MKITPRGNYVQVTKKETEHNFVQTVLWQREGKTVLLSQQPMEFSVLGETLYFVPEDSIIAEVDHAS